MDQFKNILVVRTDRIGDVVLTTPALRALRKAYPQAQISMLVRPYTKDLVQGNPNVNHILLDDREGSHKGFLGFLRLVGQIRSGKFDLAVIYHTKKRTNLACFLAGVPVRLGYKNDKYSFLLNRPVVDRRFTGDKHETEYCLELLTRIGIREQHVEMFVPLQDSAKNWYEIFCREYSIAPNDRLVAIHPGASDPARCWPTYYFAEVMEILAKRNGYKFVMLGSEETRGIITQIVKAVKFPVIDLTGKTNVAQMAYLLSRTHLMISSDSGPVHIAAALKTPVISIFTRNQPGINPERWHPLGERAKTVSVPPNMEISFKKAGTVNAKYLELIKPEAVLQAVDALNKLC